MKLTETELQELAKQLRCPDGENGIKVGEMMNFTNNNVINKTIKSLHLQDDNTILEIGPGNGSHIASIFSIATNIHYQGIDISETMVAEARKLNSGLEHISFLLTDGKHIPFPENQFDRIFTTNTIYFWKNPQAYTNEITRVLKSDGILSIGFIPKSTMQHIPFAKFGFNLYTIETVRELLEKAGLKVLQAKTETEFVTTNSGERVEREFVIMSAKK